MTTAMLHIGPIAVPPAELHFTFTRSGGPGGQNVNKTNTRVTLAFDLDRSPALTDQQRASIRAALHRRIGRDGILRITASRHRTQRANRQATVERFTDLLTRALTPRPMRRPTAIPAAAQRRRLEAKRAHSERKRTRRTAPPADPD